MHNWEESRFPYRFANMETYELGVLGRRPARNNIGLRWDGLIPIPTTIQPTSFRYTSGALIFHFQGKQRLLLLKGWTVPRAILTVSYLRVWLQLGWPDSFFLIPKEMCLFSIKENIMNF